MLTPKTLAALKPREKAYKTADAEGLYVVTTPTGAQSFRYDYRVNGRRETLVIGRYDAEQARQPQRDPDALDYGMSLSLAEARELLRRARRTVERGESPSRAKVEARNDAANARSFGGWADMYFQHKADPKSGEQQLAESTLAFRRSTYRRIIEPAYGRLRLEEVTPARLKALCDEVKSKRGPAVAVHVREVVQMVFRHAQASGQTTTNPADLVETRSIATFKPRERFLAPAEIRLFLAALERTAAMPTLRLALKFILLTGVRKGEFIEATWKEIDFDTDTWTIPAARMKASKPHIIPLSSQALDILTALRECFPVSPYLHPSRYDSDTPISNATLNRVIDSAIEVIHKENPSFESFSVHDLRRTFSTGLNSAKFDDRWIEFALAHAPRNQIAATYNANRWLDERRIMIQAWGDAVDAWGRGESAREVFTEAKRRAAEVPEPELEFDL